MADLKQGSLVWATVADPHGRNLKSRPLVLVTPTEEIGGAAVLVGVAVTSRADKPLPVDHVELPWHPDGHPRTKLKKRSFAVCRWLVTIDPADILGSEGARPRRQARRHPGKAASIRRPVNPSPRPPRL